MEKIIVFGSSGILGKIIVKQIQAQFGEKSIVISDYLPERAKNLSDSLNISAEPRIIDVNDISSIKSGLNGLTGAVIATKQHTPNIQALCIKKGIASVDVTVFRPFVQQVQKLDEMARQQSVPTLVMAGYFPGLSGIAVNELVNYFDIPQKVRVSLLQNTNASAGKYGFADMLNIINSDIPTKEGMVKGFKLTREFFHHDYNKIFEQFYIRSDEAEILSDQCKLDIKYYTGWEKESFNYFIKILNRSGLSKFLANNALGLKLASIIHPPKKYNETNQEKTSLTITGAGLKEGTLEEKTIHINTKADYLATAISATTMLSFLLERKTNIQGGVFMPHQLFNLDMIKNQLKSSDIEIISS